MKRVKIMSSEEFRLDRFIVRRYGYYSYIFFEAIINWNPTVDFSNLISGTVLKVPSMAEITQSGNSRGKYKLFKES